MRRFNASLGFVMAGLLVVALLAGCSDDGKSTATKPTAAAGKKASDSKAIEKASAATAKPTSAAAKPLSEQPPEPSPQPKETVKPDVKPPVKTEAKPEVKIEAKPDVKTEAKPETKTEAKPEVKSDAKPLEGKVEVKAEPDSSDESKPEAKPAAKPETAKEASPTSTSASSDDATPKFSSFAPADDLAAELKILITDLEKAIVSEDEYKSQVEGRFTRDGNTIALVAIALGLHDQDSPLKPNAKAITAAALKLAQAKDYAATTQAVADLKAAVDGKGAGGEELKWAKV